MDLKNKKILLVGLGILGGGLSMANYLIDQGAILTITDLRSREDLSEMINKLKEKSKKNIASIKFTLGLHKESDFNNADLIIFNPAVPVTSEWVKLAKKLKKP